MALHLIKLSVGSGSFDDLAAYQSGRLAAMRESGETPELMHVTRSTPRRADEILPDGSIYWVVKGVIVARQVLLGFRPVMRESGEHCALLLAPSLVKVEHRACRPFQGWRYLKPDDAPPDASASTSAGEMSEQLKQSLRELGLL